MKRKPVARRDSSFRTIATLTVVPVIAFIGYYGYKFVAQTLLSAPSKPQPKIVSAPKLAAVTQTGASEPQAPKRGADVSSARPPESGRDVRSPRSHGHGEIVLILDDVGFDRQPIDEAMRIDPNVNFSILPNGSEAQEFAERLNAKGFELLCHLPMEPIDYPRQQPGANAILTSMSDDEITAKTRLNIESVPHIRGVNNHMGSRATRDARVMRDVLTALPKDLYFIDSRTSEGSIAGRMARQMNIPTASRNVFLDDVQSERAVRHQLDILASLAEEHGIAIGIGHPHPVTIRVLNELAPSLRARGLRFVRASEVVR